MRTNPEEHHEVRRRAQMAGLTLSRYLVECGLSDGRQPDPPTRAWRERAVFEVRHIRHTLRAAAARRDGDTPVSEEEWRATLAEVRAALAELRAAWRKEVRRDGGK